MNVVLQYISDETYMFYQTQILHVIQVHVPYFCRPHTSHTLRSFFKHPADLTFVTLCRPFFQTPCRSHTCHTMQTFFSNTLQIYTLQTFFQTPCRHNTLQTFFYSLQTFLTKFLCRQSPCRHKSCRQSCCRRYPRADVFFVQTFLYFRTDDK